jgi:hypothetical protein
MFALETSVAPVPLLKAHRLLIGGEASHGAQHRDDGPPHGVQLARLLLVG